LISNYTAIMAGAESSGCICKQPWQTGSATEAARVWENLTEL